MLRLPRNLPGELRRQLEPCLEEPRLEEALPSVCRAIIYLFSAQDAICAYHQRQLLGEGEKSAFIRHVFSAQGSGAPNTNLLETKWLSSGIDEFLRKDLEARLAAVSYSAFSWPYPSLSDEALSSAGLKVPREYSLVLPYCSELVIQGENEPRFSGYFVIFFNRFPKLHDMAVQLIITLPPLLSDIAASYSRRTINARAGELSIYAHDIKRYLLINREFIRAIRDQDGKQRKRTIDSLERSLFRMLHQTNSLLLADKDEFGNLHVNPVSADLNELVQEAVNDISPLFQSKKISLKTLYTESLPEAKIDPALFPSVILNLLDNALKYTDEGGSVVVRTYLGSNNSVVMEVEDNGPKIPDEECGSIFSKRFRGSNSDGRLGNGLGLYLVRRVVEAHGADVMLCQDNGRKKIFRVAFPGTKGIMQTSPTIAGK